MKWKSVSTIYLIPLLFLIPLMSSGVVYAIPPTPVSGSYEAIKIDIVSQQLVGSNMVVIQITESTVTFGPITGTLVSNEIIVINLSTGTGTFQILGKYTSGIGTMLMRIQGKIDGFIFIQGKWVILSGTDAFAGLHGQGSLEGTTDSGTLSGQIHTEPK